MHSNNNSLNIELERQSLFIQKIKALLNVNYKKLNKQLKVFIHTFGCQMNVHDSEKIIGMFAEMGVSQTLDEMNADFIVYNTCCVRENAENKVYGNLGYLKKIKSQNPNLKIILCGCMMQQDVVISKIKNSYRNVDVIFGTFNLHRLPQLLYTNMETNDMIIDVWEEHAEIIEDLPIIREKKFNASVNIMYGCDNFCSYCIVPFVRGRERSREAEDIINEIMTLVKDGVREIMLLGQNVNSYGKNLENPISFAELLIKINEIPGLDRIRFMTSHPKDLSDELIEALRLEHICKHLHLPVQSGSTNILTKMNRKYTREEYLSLVRKIKEKIPDIHISTDIIVGFPGESEQDFNETLDLVRQVGFSSVFTFKYSVRIGTVAAHSDFEEQAPEDVVSERFSRLLDTVNSIIFDINTSLIGTKQKVLVEEIGANAADDSIMTGRTDSNSIVHFKILPCADKDKLIGNIVDVTITGCKTFYLTGEMSVN